MKGTAAIPFWMKNLLDIIDQERVQPSTYTVTAAFDLFAKELQSVPRVDPESEGDVSDKFAMCEWAISSCTKAKADAWMFSSLLRLLGLLGWFKCSDGATRVRSVLLQMVSTSTPPTGAFIRVLLGCMQDLPHNGDHLVLLDDIVALMRTNNILQDEYMDSAMYSIRTRERLPVFCELTKQNRIVA
jgi:hypothetical protein